MSASTDPGHFFQTSASLAAQSRKAAKRSLHATAGRPVTLPSKILAVHPSPASPSEAFVALSDATLRLVYLHPLFPDEEHKRFATTFRGPAAPLTCVAFSRDGSKVFAGCWDRDVWSWDVGGTRHPWKKFHGCADFVKCVGVVGCAMGGMNGGEMLVAGDARGNVVGWSALNGQRVWKVNREEGRGLLTMLFVPRVEGDSEDDGGGGGGSPEMWTGSSTGDVRRWRVKKDGLDELGAVGSGDDSSSNARTLAGLHETSVNKLFSPSAIPSPLPPGEAVEDDYGNGDEDDEGEGTQIWTASSDNTAKSLVVKKKKKNNNKPKMTSSSSPPRSSSTAGSGGGDSGGTVTMRVGSTLQHPDFVRDVVFSPSLGLAVTACRDEEVRVWDVDGGGGGGGGGGVELVCTYSGHWEEVTGLCLRVVDGRRVCVSVSIDGTLRTWGLEKADLEKQRRQEEARRAAAAAAATAATGAAGGVEQQGDDWEEGGAGEEDGAGGNSSISNNNNNKGSGTTTTKKQQQQKVELTEEEERELAELMEDDDDDDDGK